MKRNDKKVIAFWSPVSHTGKSFIASNIATKLSDEDFFVGVIDLNKQFSSLPVLLDLEIPKEKSLLNAFNANNEAEMLKNFVKHPDRDLYLLALNIDNKIDELHKLVPSKINNLISICREKFDVLLVDLPSSYIELTSYEVLKNHSENTVVVFDNDINTVTAYKKYVEFFKEVNISTNDFSYVMNKDDGLIDIKEIEEQLGIEIEFIIPNKKFITKSTNEGKPIMEIVPSSRAEKNVVKNLKNLTNTLVYEKELAKEKTKKFKIPFTKKGDK